MLKSAVWFGAGYASWPLFEYAFHRFVFHNPDEETTGANVHTKHHRDPAEYNDFAWKDALMELKEVVPKAVGGITAGLCLTLGPKRGLPLMAGLLTHWVFYERLHLETHAMEKIPDDPKLQHLYRHHMYHHFKNPRVNHGFTTDFFDKLFGTYEDTSDVINVPAHMAPKWMTEDTEGYKIVGKRKKAS